MGLRNTRALVSVVPEQYRADGTCRCDKPTADMADTGYTWNEEAGRWQA
jgi:hypothetical protein